MNAISAAIPTSTLVDAQGNIRPEWRSFFTQLWLRTGGAAGQSTDTSHLQQQIDNEAIVRAAADATLTTNLGTETAARIAGDKANSDGLLVETTLRQRADATIVASLTSYVPITQLCSLWAACDLTFLPTADPGSGKPWLDDNHLAVGTSSSVLTGIGLEDATGAWGREDATGAWLYG